MKYDNASLVQIPSGYKASTLYSVLPANGNGDFTHTRGSSATRVNENGLIESVGSNVPRLDYPLLNGVVQDCPSLLLEPSRTNLIAYSEAFDNGAWLKSGLTVDANKILSPYGSLDADEINITTANAHYLFNSISVSAETNYTFTFYVKKGTATDVSYSILNEINFTNIVNTTSYFNEISDTEWTRISVEFTTPSGCTSIRTYPLRDGFSIGTVYIWGGQLEQGSYATSYIPTSGTTVTRAAETCNGAGTASEFNDSEGVLFAEIAALSDDSTNRQITLSDGTATNRLVLKYDNQSNIIQVFNRVGGSETAFLNASVSDITLFNKCLLKYKVNDYALWINGFEVDTDTVSTIFPSNTLNDLSFGDGSSNFYGNTKQLATFNVALSDTQLEDLTSWDSFAEMAQSQLYTIE